MQKESGRGHDLDVSLFERLVSEGFPFCALQQQHRMRTEIAAPVRALTYPDLTDGPGTRGREHVRGLSRDVVFVDHLWPEGAGDDDSDTAAGAKREATASKVNAREADLAACVLRYLLQQGYAAAQLVLLTPYLRQVRLLREQLRARGLMGRVGERDNLELEAAGLVEQVRSAFASHAMLCIAALCSLQDVGASV